MSVTIALDLDGVVSPIIEESNGRPAEAIHDLGGTYLYFPEILTGSLVAADTVSVLQELHQRADVTIAWHTSWWDEVHDEFTPALHLPNWPMFGTEAEYRATTDKWWKLASVERWLRQARPGDTLIWVEDEITTAIAEHSIPDWVRHDPRLIIVSPMKRRGLTAADLNFIVSAVG